ncbi:MAG: ABC transporter permease [Sandaracinaceae bacterium]|nr:ABC transporter permease [Sandaracinaceae bacterium]
MLWNTILLAFRSIRRNLVRSLLTTLGVVIGVAAVITMVTLGQGATEAVSRQIAGLGSNLLLLVPGQRFGPGADTAPPFDLADAEALRSQIDTLAAVAPTAQKSATAVYGAENWGTGVTGATNDYFIAGAWQLAAGRTFTAAEERGGKAVCILGETVRRNLFGDESPLGSSIRVEQFACEIIGVLEAKGQGMGGDQDDTIVMPLRAVQRRLTGTQDVSSIRVSVREAASIEEAQEQILEIMRARRHIDENEQDDFRVLDTRQIAQTLAGTTRTLTLLLGAVAAVSLLVGGIGIMNIMLVSVTERTREIGIRLAVGALEREVLLQFLLEAVVLSAFGGVIGMVLAAVLSAVLADLLDVTYAFDASINVLAFTVAAAIGVLFGYFPARRAARLDPIEALRHE